LAFFRARQETVEATQFWRDGDHTHVYRDHPQSKAYIVDMMGKKIYVEPGDWIVKDLVDGRHFKIGRAVFERRFEPVLADVEMEPGPNSVFKDGKKTSLNVEDLHVEIVPPK
jgi:hypothetical protein